MLELEAWSGVRVKLWSVFCAMAVPLTVKTVPAGAPAMVTPVTDSFAWLSETSSVKDEEPCCWLDSVVGALMAAPWVCAVTV